MCSDLAKFLTQRRNLKVVLLLVLGYCTFYYFRTFQQVLPSVALYSRNIYMGLNKNYSSKAYLYRPRLTCNCNRVSTFSHKTFEPGLESKNLFALLNSTCSPEATEEGVQNVITYTYYNGRRKGRDYVQDLDEILKTTASFYPGWHVRLYSSVNDTEMFCKQICGNQDIFNYCPIEFMEHFEKGHFKEQFPLQWRFIALGKPTVRKLLVKDLDSRPTQREVDAVSAWESSGLPFHSMRDHRYHSFVMLGGMWGADTSLLDYNSAHAISRQLIYHKSSNDDQDQTSLKKYVYDVFQKNGSILTHDSYLCNKFKDSVPFPTQRRDNHAFVGKPVYSVHDGLVTECPKACRPSYGQNWTYC